MSFQFARSDIDKVKALVNRRVAVSGNVRYLTNGAPRAIGNVIEIEDASHDDHLPGPKFGTVPDVRVMEGGAASVLQTAWEREDN